MIWVYLRRGLLAGLFAGFLAGLFGFVVGEPILDRAIALEERAHAGERHEALFDRGEQKAGLFLATGLYGSAVGVLFGLASAYLRGRVSPARGEWERSLGLSAALFAGAVLAPFLKYPPNPPGVGTDPETLTARTLLYLAMVFLSLLAVFFAWRLARQLGELAASVRHLAVGAFLVVCWALLLYVLPGPGTDAGNAPAELVWGFRLSASGTQMVLWGGIGCVFGLLGERAEVATRSSSREAVQ